MFPMDRKVLQAPVVLEYDARSNRSTSCNRVRREYPNSFQARAAYRRLDKQGRQPQVVARPGKPSHS